MSQRLSRRELASALAAASTLPAAAAGQATQSQPEDLLRNAREQVARNAELLSKYSLPVSAEPAFVFKP